MPSGNSAKQTVVVIEDDLDLCTLLEYNLTRSGYNVRAQHSIAGALEAIEESAASLIILDVMLPDGDGFDFCRKLRRDPNLDHVPILFLTASFSRNRPRTWPRDWRRRLHHEAV